MWVEQDAHFVYARSKQLFHLWQQYCYIVANTGQVTDQAILIFHYPLHTPGKKLFSMKAHFLRAEWNNLITANYVVPKELLAPYVPYKTELDLFEGNAYLSLVGFKFLNTKVFGLHIPMHVDFEKVNLRFYVKYHDRGLIKRGVVFIKEIVPKIGISFIANNVFRERYATMKMTHFNIDKGEHLETGYDWKHKDKWNKLSVVAEKRSKKIVPDSCEYFFTDHYWDYQKLSDTKTGEYNVEHPVWETLTVISYNIDCDFDALYGKEFAFLNQAEPASVIMTRGSEIRIHNKKIIE